MPEQETRTDVSRRHREEWRAFREAILSHVLDTQDNDAAKFAKAYADILKVYQEGERKAWGFADTDATDESIEYAWAPEKDQ